MCALLQTDPHLVSALSPNEPGKGVRALGSGEGYQVTTMRTWGAPLAQCARSAGTVQLFGRLAVLETHTL